MTSVIVTIVLNLLFLVVLVGGIFFTLKKSKRIAIYFGFADGEETVGDKNFRENIFKKEG